MWSKEVHRGWLRREGTVVAELWPSLAVNKVRFYDVPPFRSYWQLIRRGLSENRAILRQGNYQFIPGTETRKCEGVEWRSVSCFHRDVLQKRNVFASGKMETVLTNVFYSGQSNTQVWMKPFQTPCLRHVTLENVPVAFVIRPLLDPRLLFSYMMFVVVPPITLYSVVIHSRKRVATVPCPSNKIGRNKFWAKER